MKLLQLVRRFLIPGHVTTLRCLLRYGAEVSPRAEVELTDNLQLGKRVRIGSFVKIKSSDGPLQIGARTDIANGCFLASLEGGLTIGNDVLIGPNSVILSNTYNYGKLGVPLDEQGTASKGTTIGDRTFIGANSVVLDGARIGADVIVTPGSVVAGRIPDGAIVSGNPAREVFRRR